MLVGRPRVCSTYCLVSPGRIVRARAAVERALKPSEQTKRAATTNIPRTIMPSLFTEVGRLTWRGECFHDLLRSTGREIVFARIFSHHAQRYARAGRRSIVDIARQPAHFHSRRVSSHGVATEHSPRRQPWDAARWTKPRSGESSTVSAFFCRPCRSWEISPLVTHGWRRGLFSATALRLFSVSLFRTQFGR